MKLNALQEIYSLGFFLQVIITVMLSFRTHIYVYFVNASDGICPSL